MTLPCWTAIFISRFHILWLHILCVFLASHKTEIMSVISTVAPLRGRPPSILSNPISLFSGCLFLSSGVTPGSLPASTFGPLLFVEHRQAFVRRMSLIRQPMTLIFSSFRKKTYASLASPGCFSSLRNVPVLFRTETRVVCHSTLFPLRAQSPRRNAVKSSLHSFRVPPVMLSIFPCS